MTRTKFGSWVKAEIASFIIMVLCSFLFWSVIWRMAPIPSAAYPFIQKMWPYYAYLKTLWATSTSEGGAQFMREAIDASRIFWSAGVGAALFGLVSLLRLPAQLFYGIVGGVGMFPHHTLPMFIGALLGRYYFAVRFGRERWRSYAPIILAGYACGVGLIGMGAVGLALIAKSVSQLAF